MSSHDRGAFLTLASNGMHALRQIKADTAVSAVSAPLRTMRICNGAGHEIVTVPLGDAHDPAIGYRYLTRAALCSALHAKRRNRESVSNGETPHPRPHHRTAIFSDGSRASSDVLAAAIVRAAHQILVTNAYDLRSQQVASGSHAHHRRRRARRLPATGQGASLALEDAVILAKSLRDSLDEARAVDLYEQLRRNRVQANITASARMSEPSRLDGHQPSAGKPASTCQRRHLRPTRLAQAAGLDNHPHRRVKLAALPEC